MRTRNIRPGFFRNENLGQLPFEARLLFQGLWCVADCEGRLEDRPLRLKADLFPYDVIDVAALLAMLVEHGLVLRYESEGKQLLWIPTFRKHQLISKKERDKGSAWPPHPDDSGAAPAPPRPKPSARPGPAQAQPGSNPAPSRDPTSPGSDNGQRTTDNGQLTTDNARPRPEPPADAGGVSESVGPKRKPPPATTFAQLQRAWNEHAHPAMPRCVEEPKLSGPMRAELRQRPLDGPTGWLALIDRMNASTWCRGEAPTSTRAMDVSFLLRHPADLLNGKYDDRTPPRLNTKPETDWERRAREKYGSA